MKSLSLNVTQSCHMAAFLVLFFLIANYSYSQGYYIDSGPGNITYVKNGDPNEIAPKYWVVRLYAKGKPKTGKAWGAIMGKTASEVMEELRKKQDFEEKIKSEVEHYDPLLSYFNYLGPIAIVRNTTNNNQSTKFSKKVEDAMDRLVRLKNMINKYYQNMTAGGNPYKNVGNVVADYTKTLAQAETNLSDARNILFNVNNSLLGQIDEQLKKVDANFATAEKQNSIIEVKFKQQETNTFSKMSVEEIAEKAYGYFYGGFGEGQNLPLASKYSKYAAERENAKGQFIYGVCFHDMALYYHDGQEEKNKSEAKKWLLKAAENGYFEAQWYYANFYSSSEAEKTQWMIKAARNGHYIAKAWCQENKINY